MEKKHLAFYEECMKSGLLPSNGLCGCADDGFIDKALLEELTPTHDGFKKLYEDGYTALQGLGYWGAGQKLHDYQDGFSRSSAFTPLRQTIVLFMAALNGELWK